MNLDRYESSSPVPGIPREAIYEREILVPPREEQGAIVRFLEEKERDIDRYLTAKRRMIESLSLRIDSAVTHSLCRELYVDMLSDLKRQSLPNGWSNVRLRFLISNFEQGWSPQCDEHPPSEGQWGVVKVGCVGRGEFDPSQVKALPAGIPPVAELEIRPGDLLICRANGSLNLLGRAALVVKTPPRLLLCDKLFRITTDCRTLLPEYLALYLRSSHIRRHIELRASGGEGLAKNIGQDAIRDIPVVLPSVAMQRVFAEALRREIDELRLAVNSIEKEIVAMEEYRIRLIADAVTGQIDVRRAT